MRTLTLRRASRGRRLTEWRVRRTDGWRAPQSIEAVVVVRFAAIRNARLAAAARADRGASVPPDATAGTALDPLSGGCATHRDAGERPVDRCQRRSVEPASPLLNLPPVRPYN
jgi:hypothetical protein